MPDLEYLTPDATATRVRVHHSHLTGYAVLGCPCGAPIPLVIPDLTAAAQCHACRGRYIIASATYRVDPCTQEISVDMQVARLSSLVTSPARQ